MCAEIRIPQEVLDPPTGGGSVFPEGWYRGTITPFENDLQNIRPVNWETEEDDIRLNVKLGDTEAIEGDDPGDRNFFFDAPLIRGTLTVDSEDAATWAQSLRTKSGDLGEGQRAVGAGFQRLVNLARATGFLDGASAFDPMAFAESVENGDLNGTTISFRVYHTTSKKNGKTYANLGELAPA